MPLSITDQLIQHEGIELHAYQDSLGFWTIGVGRLIDGRKGGGISHNEALTLLKHDINSVMNDLDKWFPWWDKLDGVRQRVMIDMCFNLGVDGLRKFKTTLNHIEDGDWKEASRAMRASLWHTQVGNRAERLARMMESGEDVKKWW